MTRHGRYGDLDYPTLTKRGFALGLALFLVGAVGGKFGPALLGSAPPWFGTVMFDLEAFGVLLCLFVPFVFGIFLPLTE